MRERIEERTHAEPAFVWNLRAHTLPLSLSLCLPPFLSALLLLSTSLSLGLLSRIVFACKQGRGINSHPPQSGGALALLSH